MLGCYNLVSDDLISSDNPSLFFTDCMGPTSAFKAWTFSYSNSRILRDDSKASTDLIRENNFWHVGLSSWTHADEWLETFEFWDLDFFARAASGVSGLSAINPSSWPMMSEIFPDRVRRASPNFLKLRYSWEEKGLSWLTLSQQQTKYEFIKKLVLSKKACAGPQASTAPIPFPSDSSLLEPTGEGARERPSRVGLKAGMFFAWAARWEKQKMDMGKGFLTSNQHATLLWLVFSNGFWKFYPNHGLSPLHPCYAPPSPVPLRYLRPRPLRQFPRNTW